MKPTVQVVRAIAAEYARRKVNPLLMIVGCVLAVLLLVGIWLVTINAWWWFLLAPIIIATVVYLVLAITIYVVLRIVASEQTRAQKKDVKAYVDQLERVSDSVQTPYPVLLFRVITDVFRPKSDGFVVSVSQASMTLAPGFINLIKSFSDTNKIV